MHSSATGALQTASLSANADAAPLHETVRHEQIQTHFAQIPAMVIAPTAGGLFTTWVLWNAVNNRVLVAGMAAVAVLSSLRLWLYRLYVTSPPPQRQQALWGRLAVAGALASGCLWGAAAPCLYPPAQPEYEIYLVVLLTLLPIVPVAALATYLPAFYAYYLPCFVPFVVMLALRDTRGERLTALLLVMMMFAMQSFARRYSRVLSEAIGLRVQLAQESAALQSTIRQKTRFIAQASHDLRQPVHAMGLFLESLRSRREARIDTAIDHLEASQRGLRDMLGNMLDISKLDAKMVEPRLQPVLAHELLRRLGDEFCPQAAAKGLELRCRLHHAVVRSDPALLERMVRNLLSNALKFTDRGGVLLASRRRGRGLSIQVIDTGVGIPGHRERAVFEPFVRLPSAEREGPGGLGLGLAIVRQTADLLGHAIWLRSKPGQGSVFGIELEITAQTPSPSLPIEPPMPQAALRPCTVLIVDDDAAVRNATVSLVSGWGLRATCHASTEQALRAMDAQDPAPDLLLIDFRLAKGASGLAGVASIRHRLARDIPVILITGDTAPDRILEAVAAGHTLLHKPVDPLRLRACMVAALQEDGPPATRSPS